ncbi:MAG: hypothetical protein Q7S51_02895 [Gallionellaceae bacterium]|nr:hypothetical protein [Gallionellaceae bacterium]
MRIFNSLVILFVVASHAQITQATEDMVTISSPKEGAKLSTHKKIKVTFKAQPGPNADHLHLYVDEQEPIMLHKLKGSYMVEPLAVGKHGICVRVVNKEHVESEVQDCVMFRVE